MAEIETTSKILAIPRSAQRGPGPLAKADERRERSTFHPPIGVIASPQCGRGNPSVSRSYNQLWWVASSPSAPRNDAGEGGGASPDAVGIGVLDR